MSNQIERLMKWYQSHCDGDWEHDQRVRIGTLDNPGWTLDVNVAGTEASGRTIALTRIERDERNWVHYEVARDAFIGQGGASNLAELLELFLGFVEQDQ